MIHHRVAGSRAPDEPIVVGTGIVKHWGSTAALDGATFTVGRGITGLLGANGAGKTTLLGMMLGLHRPNQGQLTVLGLDPVRAGAEVRERVGYSPEHHTLPPDTTAQDLVRHIAEIHGLPAREATGRASDALWQVGLGEERFRPIGTMSTGQRQRVKLAQAIAHDPHLVLLDEPTDGLDPVQRDDMLALIRRVGTEFGIDIILSSHLLEEVERLCDDAIILGGGKVVAAGAIAELTGADRGLLIEVDERPAELAEALSRRGLLVARDGHRLIVTSRPEDLAPTPTLGAATNGATATTTNGATVEPRTPDASLYPVVRDALVASGAGLRRLTNRTVSLEDVFLEVDPVTVAPGPAAPAGAAHIFDRGYRPYDGPRLGLRGAMASLTRHSIQRALGLKRTFWNKILPFLAIFLAYVPAIVFVGIAAFLKSRLNRSGVDLDQILPTYAQYYSFIWAAITVFAAFVAPEMLCTDRRTGMLGLYLASPLRHDSYLVAKAAAVAFVLLLVSLGPPLFMLVARTIAGSGPSDALAFAGILGRVLVSGVVVAALPAALSLALASTTTRRAAASAAFVLIEIGSVAVTQSLILAGNSATLFVADLAYLPLELVVRIYGEPAGETLPTASSVPTATLAVAYVVLTGALVGFVWFRYRRIQVTR